MNVRNLLLIAAVALFALPSMGQKKNREEMHREFREFKIKYIVQEIELPADKAKEFGEIYLQMEEERHKNFSTTRKLEKSVTGNSKSTDADYARLSEALVQSKSKDADITRRYEEKFSKLLTPRQLYKMKDAEESFRRKMEQMRKQKRGKRRAKAK